MMANATVADFQKLYRTIEKLAKNCPKLRERLEDRPPPIWMEVQIDVNRPLIPQLEATRAKAEWLQTDRGKSSLKNNHEHDKAEIQIAMRAIELWSTGASYQSIGTDLSLGRNGDPDGIRTKVKRLIDKWVMNHPYQEPHPEYVRMPSKKGKKKSLATDRQSQGEGA